MNWSENSPFVFRETSNGEEAHRIQDEMFARRGC